MKYTDQQIETAKQNAGLHGYDSTSVTDKLAIEFLEWYHSAETEYDSIEEAKRVGLSGLVTNGVRQQREFWRSHLIQKTR